MRIIQTEFDDVKIFEPTVYNDERGYFYELYKIIQHQNNGIVKNEFIQDNLSFSKRGVLRGLHYQTPPFEQAKLVTVVRGKIFDVIVDVRENSPNFMRHIAVTLSGDNRRQVYVPKGYAHGFMTVSEDAHVLYKVDNHYSPDHEKCIHWADPKLSIPWPNGEKIVSTKDSEAPFYEK